MSHDVDDELAQLEAQLTDDLDADGHDMDVADGDGDAGDDGQNHEQLMRIAEKALKQFGVSNHPTGEEDDESLQDGGDEDSTTAAELAALAREVANETGSHGHGTDDVDDELAALEQSERKKKQSTANESAAAPLKTTSSTTQATSKTPKTPPPPKPKPMSSANVNTSAAAAASSKKSTPPPPPSHPPAKTTPTSKSATKSTQKVNSPASKKLQIASPQNVTPTSRVTSGDLTVRQSLEYENLIKKLELQQQDLRNAIKALLTPPADGEVSQNTKLVALQYHRRKKQTDTDLEVLRTAMNRKLPPPSYHTEPVEFLEEHRNEDVHEERIQVHIEEAILAKSNSVYIEISLDGPPINGTTKYPTYTTSTEKGERIPFKYRCNFEIGKRADKNRAKRVKRSKIHFVVYKKKLFGSKEFGRGELKLTDLLTHSEKKYPVSIRNEESNEKIGDLQIELRAHSAIEKMEVRKRTIPLLCIDEFETALPVADSTSNAQSMPGSAPAAIPTPESTPTVKSTPSRTLETPKQPAPPAAPAAKSPPPLPEGITEADLSNPHDLAVIFSNDVLEWEIGTNIPNLIAEAKSRKEPTDELENRLALGKTQLLILENAVQSDQLTMERYLEELRKSIQSHNKLAVCLSQRDRKSDAIMVLRRARIMKTELETAETAIANGEA